MGFMYALQAPDHGQERLLVDTAIKAGVNLWCHRQVDESTFILESYEHHPFCRSRGLLDQHHAEHEYIAVSWQFQ